MKYELIAYSWKRTRSHIRDVAKDRQELARLLNVALDFNPDLIIIRSIRE